MNSPDKKIVLDADVLSHFIKGEQLYKLPIIYPQRLVILDIVKQEITIRTGWDDIIQNFIRDSDVQELNFPEDEEYIKEYAFLTSLRGHALGRGESACLVYCRFNKNILASSNLKDIRRYCDFHNIINITTKDIILEGFNQEILSEDECDDFIHAIKSKGSKFPYNSFSEIIDDI